MPETGMFTVNADARTVRGVLIPWGVKSRESASKNKPIVFPADSIRLPRDHSVVGLNKEHDRFMPLGRATVLESQPTGLFAEFTIADTEEGDAWLADHEGQVGLSAELTDIERSADDTGKAYLTGAAVVREPAFEGAGLFSALTPEKPAETPVPEVIDPAEPENEEEETVADAVVPSQMLASRRPADAKKKLTKNGFFAALQNWTKTGSTDALQEFESDAREVGLFALTDIKFDGTGGLLTDATYPGAWLGELWTGRQFQRTVVPLITSGTLTAMSAVGWVWGVKPAMAAWTGNKAAVPSNTPTVTPKTFAATRFAGGHDLAREYIDFGVTEVIDSYVRAMVDSYAVLSDAYALAQLKAGATTFTPDTVTGNKSLSAIIDGALAVITAGGTPSFALVAPDIYKSVLKTPASSALEYLDATVGLTETGTSGFRIVPDARLTAGDIIVGDKAGAVAWELPGSPIRVSLPDLVKGGIDEAFFGYIAVGVTTPGVIVKAAGVVPNPTLLEGEPQVQDAKSAK